MRIWSLPLAFALVAGPLQADDKPIAVPYKLLDTKHVMVRVKINGKGPFNLIVDTGAPAVFLATTAAKKAGLEAGRDGWAAIDRLELEGGLVVPKAKCVVEDPFQLKGMNAMGLAGVELHGMLGFNVLARYKIQYNFTADKLLLTPLDYTPPSVERMGGGSGQPGGLEMIGSLMKLLGPLMGLNGPPDRQPRGFLGAEFAEMDGVVVKSILPRGPADQAGLKVGDRIEKAGKARIEELSDLTKLLDKMQGGEELTLNVKRGTSEEKATVTLGKGL